MEHNILQTRGDTFFKSLEFRTNGSPLDITDCIITFSIKENITDEEPLIQEEATITDAVNGLAEILIDGSTMELELKNYYYDIQFIDTNGTIVTILKGLFTIIYEITN